MQADSRRRSPLAFVLVVLAGLGLGFSLTSCDPDEDTKAEDAVEEAADTIEDTAEEAADEIEDATDGH